MGIYLNPGCDEYKKAINSEIYVDKTGLIAFTNRKLNTEYQNICVSRPRRFGKSMAANMLVAYYCKNIDSKDMFSGFKIAEDETFEKHLNKYNVIHINMIDFLTRAESIDDLIDYLQRRLLWDIRKEYSDVECFDWNDLVDVLETIYSEKKQSFVIIIDEWDCIFRKYPDNVEEQKKYLDFLRFFIKGKSYVALAYMTGILPIKKYGEHSALNMFDEFSMIDPGPLARYVGFTENEVKKLCEQYQMDMAEIKNWYDGYSFENGISIYSPRSVINCMRFGKIGNYWNQTETFEALRIYIEMNFEGLKDDVISMIAGNAVPVNTGSFANDMSTFHTEDDVLTLLIHLGYVSYDYDNKTVKIPNEEVRTEYVNSISASTWGEVSKALKESADTLEAIWQKRPKQVAEAVRQAHFETSHIQYNDENALSYTISLALYAARNFYVIHRELAGGKGFADLVFLPRKKFPEKPAIVVELKWDKTAEGAIAQIKKKEYCRSLEEYEGNILLVGVNYNKQTKEHECVIEEYVK